MRLINILFFLIVISLSPLVWANNIHYKLDVTIDTQTQKLTGIVNVTAAENRLITFMVANLSKLTVNGKTIATEHGHITVPFKMDKKLVINYEAMLNDERTHFIAASKILKDFCVR